MSSWVEAAGLGGEFSASKEAGESKAAGGVDDAVERVVTGLEGL